MQMYCLFNYWMNYFRRTEKGLTVNSLISYIQLIQNMLECKGHLQKMSKPISDQNVFRSFQL